MLFVNRQNTVGAPAALAAHLHVLANVVASSASVYHHHASPLHLAAIVLVSVVQMKRVVKLAAVFGHGVPVRAHHHRQLYDDHF